MLRTKPRSPTRAVSIRVIFNVSHLLTHLINSYDNGLVFMLTLCQSWLWDICSGKSSTGDIFPMLQQFDCTALPWCLQEQEALRVWSNGNLTLPSYPHLLPCTVFCTCTSCSLALAFLHNKKLLTQRHDVQTVTEPTSVMNFSFPIWKHPIDSVYKKFRQHNIYGSVSFCNYAKVLK